MQPQVSAQPLGKSMTGADTDDFGEVKMAGLRYYLFYKGKCGIINDRTARALSFPKFPLVDGSGVRVSGEHIKRVCRPDLFDAPSGLPGPAPVPPSGGSVLADSLGDPLSLRREVTFAGDSNADGSGSDDDDEADDEGDAELVASFAALCADVKVIAAGIKSLARLP